MKSRALLIGLVMVLLVALLMAPISDAQAQDDTPPDPTPASVEVGNDYFSVVTTTLPDGTGLTTQRINGPSEPPDPAAWEASRVSVLNRAATLLPGFPSYDWVFGCSAVSGAMIAAYYDHNGYVNMYDGPTNGGLMPLTDTSWETWSGYPNNPLVASHKGIDGRGITELGSIDDYWVSYFSSADDPYITGSWTQHTWGSAIGDYMFTSQSAYGPIDGETWFYNYTNSANRLYCTTMASSNLADGTLGRKLFYEARGYDVTDCYNQISDNVIAEGFSLADYQAEIDAGHPVMINLEGHTVVGYGYDGSTIYIRDTWDNNPEHVYHMEWGMYYPLTDVIEDRMYMLSVSIVHLDDDPGFSKTSPSNDATWVNPNAVTLAWEESIGASSYEYCIDVDTNCTNWVSTEMDTSVALAPLADGQTYYWQVRANSSSGITYANGGEGMLWSFTTFDPAIMTETNFVPLLTR